MKTTAFVASCPEEEFQFHSRDSVFETEGGCKAMDRHKEANLTKVKEEG
jgi:hypothetical protein